MNCKYTCEVRDEIQSVPDETACLEQLKGNNTALAAEYWAEQNICYVYFCKGRLSFAEGHVMYTRTCQSGKL